VEQLSDRKQLDKNYKLFITEKQISGNPIQTLDSTYFEVSLPDGKVIGYCFDITGSGLWGTMKGLLAVTPDLHQIINYTIYEQMETPGLGARVEEPWFKKQFSGKPTQLSGKTSDFILVPEEAPINATQVKQITGATITSASVLKMLKAALDELFKINISQISLVEDKA
jgi:Na+-transporting NADH:ubiquinone oxidoreductase subunit C